MDSQTTSAQIEQMAADWLARRDGEDWTDADEAAFVSWQAESTMHRVAVIRLKAVWQHADRLQALGAGVVPGSIPEPGQWRVFPFIDRRPPVPPSVSAAEEQVNSAESSGAGKRKRWSLAAGIVLVLSIGAIGYSRFHDPNTYRTAIGESQTVHLADGSQITLNTASSIRVTLTDSERRIELNRGEAFFEVAKDLSRPFVVGAGNKQVVAVGTAFSVRRDKDDLRVVVTEGKVAISSASSHSPTSRGGAGVRPLSAESPDMVILTAGNIARAGAAGVLVTETSIPQAEQTLSWRTGYIMLRDTPLADAIAEFNRYNERQLVIGDPALEDLRIGGNLRLTNLDVFVRILEQGFPIDADSEDDRIVLESR